GSTTNLTAEDNALRTALVVACMRALSALPFTDGEHLQSGPSKPGGTQEVHSTPQPDAASRRGVIDHAGGSQTISMIAKHPLIRTVITHRRQKR
ncbi:MAG TPA: hypothetical protein PKE36_03950, partial [Chiayiivirga sp.]|nr:hypothetical protein [Chiayiivirga sp.]